MALDRVGQLKILQLLAQAFPNSRDTQRLEPFDMGSDALNFQLAYLQQHGMISGMWSQEMGNGKKCIRAEITARGLDFIAADGGLTAILGVAAQNAEALHQPLPRVADTESAMDGWQIRSIYVASTLLMQK